MAMTGDRDNSKTRFLIVDDEPFISLLVEEMLKSMGASSIATASNGAEGLQVIKIVAHAPDVVLCDLNMPGMDGDRKSVV